MIVFRQGFIETIPDSIDVIIKFKFRPTFSEIDLITNFGGIPKYLYTIIDGISAKIPINMFDAIKRLSIVEYIEPVTEMFALDQNYEYNYRIQNYRVKSLQQQIPWGISRIRAPEVHATGNKGTGIKIGVIDTGIDYTHEDLKDNYKGGYNFINNTNDPKDDHFHGTHVAGIIAAADNNLGILGVAPEAYLYAIKVLNDKGSGTSDNLIAGIDWCRNNGIQITNMSIGFGLYCCSGQKIDCNCGTVGGCYSGYPGNGVTDAIKALYDSGVLQIAASGNNCGCGCSKTGRISTSGSCYYSTRCCTTTFIECADACPEKCNQYSDWINYPAKYPEVMAIGATDDTDNKASFSNPGLDLDVVAPGVRVYSTYPPYIALSGCTVNPDGTGCKYAYASGTSMATPHVTGLAALIKKTNQSLTNDQIREIIRSTSKDIGPIGFENFYGYGLIDAKAAVDRAIELIGGCSLPIISMTIPT